MFILVAGGGKVGYYLTRELLNHGHEVVLIEQLHRKVEALAEKLGEVVLEGDAADATTLEQAGIVRADLVIAVTGHDEDNLVICQMAKRKFHVPRTIARINNPKNENIFERLGIDKTVSTTKLVLAAIEQGIASQVQLPGTGR